MRTHTLLSLALLGLLLWASCIRANGRDDSSQNNDKGTETAQDPTSEETKEDASVETETDDDDEEEAPKKEKTSEIEEEKDVMVLHINNFARALSEYKFILVEFYAPWCGHCKRLEPLYAEAAGKLKAEGPTMRLAKVDAIEEKELADEFEVGSFPTLKLFISGDRKNPVDYTGKRTAEGIIQWMKRRSGPGAAVLDSAESAAQFVEAHNVAVVGFFGSLESEASEVFKEVSWDWTNAEFAMTSAPEVFQKYEVKANSVVLFKKFDDGRADFALSEDGKLDKNNLTTFIKTNSLELIIPFSEENAEKIFSSSIKLHNLLFINSTVESHKALMDGTRAVAKEFKDKMLFVSIDVTAAVSHVLKYFGVSTEDVPTVRIIDMETEKKFSLSTDDITAESLQQLCQEVLDGVAKPYYRTQEIPEDWDKGPVKVLVGKNFEAVALDPTKNVFVEFYAPWCGHCKKLEPVWEQLAEKYADRDDIIIAKVDSTANEIESVKVDGFPTLKYFPAGGKEVVDYSHYKRDLETLSKFLDNGGVMPKEESDEEEDGDDDEDDTDDDATTADDSKDDEESAEASPNTTVKEEL